MILRAVPAGALRAVPAGALRAVLAGAAVLFHLSDPRIDEASGIGYGIADPGVLYVQNDSGDSARFFALDARTGVTRAVYTVPGATNVDWEDLAVARDRRGVPSVWLGDIGDNDGVRAEVRLYRVDEPSGPGGPTDAPEVWRLRYPDGPQDAEGLAVATGGQAYIVTKAIGASGVYAVPAASDPLHVQLLRRIGTISFDFTGTPGGPNGFGQVTATGAALSADGRTFVVRTYTDAYVFAVRGGDVAAALRSTPARISLPAQPQGEGVTVHEGALVIDSEQVGSDVWSVPLPAVTASPTRAPVPVATTRARARHDPRWIWIGAVGALLLAIPPAVRWRRRSARSG